MPTLERDDLTLYYAERGDPTGPPVVLLLLHGLTLSSRTMERLAASLPEYRVLLLDFHGHGKSTTPRQFDRYLVAEFADDVVALLDHLEIDQAVLGGLSLGANVSYEVALRHPERVRALILEMPVFARGVTLPRTRTTRSTRSRMQPSWRLVCPDAQRIDLRSIFDFVLRQAEINRAVGAFLRSLAPAPCTRAHPLDAASAAVAFAHP